MKSEKFQKIFKLIMLIALTALITFMITTIAWYGKSKIKYIIAPGNSSDLGKRLEIYEKFIKDEYVGPIDEEKLIESAISGYVQGLGDQYSEYISKDKMKEYMEQTNGKYSGIGAYITSNLEKDRVQIVAPIKDSPAEKIGLKPGDLILKVDGVEYSANQLAQTSSAMKGTEGTTVNLEIQRDEQILEFTVERKTIKINHVESTALENNIGYMQISAFDEGCYDEFKSEFNKLKEKNIKSLIIDLRNNGGGIVDEALKIADTMVSKESILLITRGKNEDEQIRKAKADKSIDMPIVFLVNENTASASEILVAAVTENVENCKVVGTKTYGKGVIQTIYTLKDGGGLKLTTNEYFTPKKNKINTIGIKPDYEISLPNGKTMATEQIEDTQLNKAIELLK